MAMPMPSSPTSLPRRRRVPEMKDFIIPDRDFGTPAAKSKTMVTLTIDGFDVTVPEGTSIMRAAAELGISVPKLCATDSLSALSAAIAQHYPVHHIAGHEHVAPDRKKDPGEGFDWQLLQRSLGWSNDKFATKK